MQTGSERRVMRSPIPSKTPQRYDVDANDLAWAFTLISAFPLSQFLAIRFNSKRRGWLTVAVDTSTSSAICLPV